jgi:hypothetical protein
MSRPPSPAKLLAERLCRPQRIGVFGHRGVGKTTLLTMLYREAVAGRLPGLRLATADARTATYLSDKIQQLEVGEALPGTLGETELRFHLYAGNDRIELLFLDYQGEHVELGRTEPVREFLQQCDAVWLCLDAPVAGESSARWRAEQEVEQVVEDYLAGERAGEPHRPMALVLTKADLLPEPRHPEALGIIVEQQLGMTRHALNMHCPWHDVFAVSSLGSGGQLQPAGMEGPLSWLVRSLRQQDEARLEHLWKIAPGDLGLIERATRALLRRYPDSDTVKRFRRRLFAERWRRRSRRAVTVAVALAALCLGLWVYDALGERSMRKFAARNANHPEVVRSAWRTYQAWHPTRKLMRPAALRAEREDVAELDRLLRDREQQERLAGLRRSADDPDADPEAIWAEFLRFRGDFPDYDLDGEGLYLRQRLKKASDLRKEAKAAEVRAKREKEARLALRDLERAEQSATLTALVDQATRLAREHDGTSIAAQLLSRRDGYLRRIDDRDFETARDYSTRHPQNFYTRKQKYQQYLDRHPGGARVNEVKIALVRIAGEWDRHDFRLAAEHFKEKPGEVKDLRMLCRSYLTAHPDGRYRDKATELIRWCDKVSEPGEYRVTLKSGSFSKKAAYLISRGTSLSVSIEVGGVTYGPSTIVKRSYSPEWEYEFPRLVRWKLGDSVRIVVTDHYFWKRKVADTTFDDQLAMLKLTGEVEVDYGSLAFSSDFTMPTIPKVE